MNWFTEVPPARLDFFHEDFDAPRAALHPPILPEPVPESGPDHSALRQAAYEDGFAAGRAEQAEQARVILTHMASEFAAVRAELLARSEAVAQELAGALFRCFAHAFPALCAQHGAVEIAAIVQQIRPALLRDPELRIYVAPAHVEMLREQISRQHHDVAEHIHLHPAERLGPSDVILRWQHGQATREGASLWSDIQAVLSGEGLTAPPQTLNPALHEHKNAE